MLPTFSSELITFSKEAQAIPVTTTYLKGPGSRGQGADSVFPFSVPNKKLVRVPGVVRPKQTRERHLQASGGRHWLSSQDP